MPRWMEWLIASAALVLLAPFFALAALAIKRDSPGPVFYRQTRVGRHGLPFRIHKLRTMRVDLGGPELTVAGDTRITRSGQWLRRSKLDELAQLIDVWQGTMSLVGPRPDVPRYLPHYPPALRDVVLSVRPGITDPGSIAFANEAELLARAADPEATYIHEVLPAKLALSAAYVQQRSTWGDVCVIARTLRAIM